jgi:hypothetical protein
VRFAVSLGIVKRFLNTTMKAWIYMDGMKIPAEAMP